MRELDNVAVTYNDSSNLITLEDCVKLNADGIAVIVNDGKHVTFLIERG